MEIGVKSLALHSLSKFECTECSTEFAPQLTSLKRGEDTDYVGSYSCRQCSAEYGIEVVDSGSDLTIETQRLDIHSLHSFSHLKSTPKADLYEDLHTAGDLVEGIYQLDRIMDTVSINADRVIFHHDRFVGNSEFNDVPQELRTDLHNLLASAFSFNEIYSVVKEDLPTDGPVAEAKADYDSVKDVVIGLRIFAQHEKNIPIQPGFYTSLETEYAPQTFTIQISDVNVIESDIDTHPPDGYAAENGAEKHYGDISEDLIDIVQMADSFKQRVEDLVDEIKSYTETEHAEELDDYREKTDIENW